MADKTPESHIDAAQIHGELVRLDGEDVYRITDFHRLPPFFMSVASDTDLWMFVSSRGGLTAGRVEAEGSLFPYETVDKLHDGHHHTGPITMMRVVKGDDRAVFWKPFSERSNRDAPLERNLYKNTTGSQVIFEEIHRGLNLAFRHRLSASDTLGIVRSVHLENLDDRAVRVEVFDGFRNVLPFGAPLPLYQTGSCLIDAYRRTDAVANSSMVIYSLTSKILDRAEAGEELRANIVWRVGLPQGRLCLSTDAVDTFRRGGEPPAQSEVRGQRGNYLVRATVDLGPGAHEDWHLVADVGRSHGDIAEALAALERGDHDGAFIEQSLADARDGLRRIVATADGLQATGQDVTSVHHFANVLFNCMRGGVFARDYRAPTDDLADFLHVRHRAVAQRHRAWLTSSEETTLAAMIEYADASGDADLRRLVREYLPLYFGRRHGDPSRPWNRFSIQVRDGALRYEGNWRDIFQNWEALSLSFPGYLPNFLAKFVNASTIDGYNPYRITRDGLDWEVIEEDDPWSYIGYWGDHQVVYLLKFLEALPRFAPGTLESLWTAEIFSYANVPYRIAAYEQIVQDPNSTIDFDHERAVQIEERVAVLGTDGKLVLEADGSVRHVTLVEKLLVTALSKLSNLVPAGGIWMNTQRPEWNDANNALVGQGISMVTLCYLRRYLKFLVRHWSETEFASAAISTEVAHWFGNLASLYQEAHAFVEEGSIDDRVRRRFLDAWGNAFSRYRHGVYRDGFTGKEEVPTAALVAFCEDAIAVCDHAIQVSRREDGLYHAYNLLDIEPNGDIARIDRLYLMLEGQVATLSSGTLDSREALHVVDALFASDLFTAAQQSFLLYPERKLPAFLDRNVLPDDAAASCGLVQQLLDEDDGSVVYRDALGRIRFAADFTNERDLSAALDRLASDPAWSAAIGRHRGRLLELFESVFHHHSFTGRSGTMYGYEGLGCIYWHMVAKLLLAIQELALAARDEEQPEEVREAWIRAYYHVRRGLGFEKTVLEYGAFPTDPYSHTPSQGGARQPGMTGQVKEEILTRAGELGVRIEGGCLGFRPFLLRREEFTREPRRFEYLPIHGTATEHIDLEKGRLGFTFCQVPVVYSIGAGVTRTRVTTANGETHDVEADAIDVSLSAEVFARSGRVVRIDVEIPEKMLVP